MKIVLVVRKKNNAKERWEEKYDVSGVKTAAEAKNYAKVLLQDWNKTSPKAEHRVLMRVKCLGASTEHQWLKDNLVTVVSGGSNFDRYRCLCCGVTGKRLGISSRVVRDKKYEHPKYATCAWKKR